MSQQIEPEVPPRRKKLIKDKKKQKKYSQFQKPVQNYQDYFNQQASQDSQQQQKRIYPKDRQQFKLPQKQKKYDFLLLPDQQVNKHYREKERQMDQQQQMEFYVPSSKDPTVYAVQTIRRKQQDLVLQILNKASCLKDTSQKLSICSVSYFQKNPGVIFIQSYSKSAIQQSLDGLSGILSRKYEPIFAPKQIKNKDFKPDTYVRIKSGLYKGDLARVIQAKQNGKAKVQVVARIDPAQIQRLHRQSKNKQISKIIENYKYLSGSTRPQQRLLFASQLPQGIPQLKKLTLIQNGLLQLKLPTRQLTAYSNDSVKYSEIKYFRGADDPEQPIQFLKNQLRKTDVITKFQLGQKVKVIKGVYQGIKGCIQSIDQGNNFGKGAKILIKPKDKSMQPFQIAPYQIMKYFKQRNHVKVIGGKHVGKTGIILTVKDTSAIILTLNGNQITVLLNQLALSKQQRIETVDNDIHRYDLIKLNGGMGAACVLINQKDTLKVLDQHNSIRLISLLQMQHKLDTRYNYSKNNFGQQIKKGAVVRIRQGSKAGKKCQVKHVFKDLLFMYNPQFYSTGAIFADACSNVTLISTSQSTKRQYIPTTDLSKQNQYEVGSSVTIKGGQWKGYQGLVKQILKDSFMIRLSAKFMTVQIKKQYINESNMQDWGKTPKPQGGQTIYRNSPGPSNTPMI